MIPTSLHLLSRFLLAMKFPEYPVKEAVVGAAHAHKSIVGYEVGLQAKTGLHHKGQL
jgi:hypothetical protein